MKRRFVSMDSENSERRTQIFCFRFLKFLCHETRQEEGNNHFFKQNHETVFVEHHRLRNDAKFSLWQLVAPLWQLLEWFIFIIFFFESPTKKSAVRVLFSAVTRICKKYIFPLSRYLLYNYVIQHFGHLVYLSKLVR